MKTSDVDIRKGQKECPLLVFSSYMALPCSSDGKESACSAGDPG